MFVNISNHPSAKWGLAQLEAAKALGGDVRDIQFPNVPSTATSEDVAALADSLVAQVEPGAAVMCQGEFSLTFAVTSRLLAKGHQVVVACTERKVQERQLEGGKVEKTATFEFVAFRQVL